MRLLLTIFTIFFLAHAAHSQNASFEWARQFGGTSGSNGNAVVVDAAGNVYTTGQFQGSVDFDPGPGVYYMSTPGSGMFISKLDANGNFVWAKQFGGTNIGGYAIAVDGSGNIYTTGFFQYFADFDPGTGTYNLNTVHGSNIFVSKLDNNGNFVWAKQFGGTFNIYSTGFGIAVDASGNVYTTGQFDNNTDFDPGPGVVNLNAAGFEDIFLSKLDHDGNFVWVKQVGGTYNETASALSIDASGNIVSTGYFQGTVDFDPNAGATELTAAGGLDIFVCKSDPDGKLLWAKQMGGPLNDISLALALDAAGNVYATGYFSGTCDFDPMGATVPIASRGIADIFVLKLNGDGSFAWAKQMGGPDEDRAFGITVDPAGNVYTIGDFQGTANFDPGPGEYNFTTRGGQDVFISKLNNSGSFIWAKQIGGIHEDIGYAIKVDVSNNIYSTGYFSSVVDFDPGVPVFTMSSQAVNDVFVHKMKKCSNSPPTFASISACFSYTLNGHVYTTSGMYGDTLLNEGGCDSVVTINLTINGSVRDSTASACDGFTWQGHTYTSSGHYTATYTGAAGCDSILNLNLSIYHKVNTNVNAVICQGRNYAGHATPGTYIDTFVSFHGCDSVRTLTLAVKPFSTSHLSATICDGQMYLGHGNSGTHTDTLVAANGCDSVRILDLTVLPRSFTTVNATICQGQFYHAAGTNQVTTGIYRDTLTNSIGCDSIITTNLLVHASPQPNLGADRNLCTSTSFAFIAPGNFNSYLWQDNSTLPSFKVSGIGKYWVTVTDGYGCKATDSVSISAIDTIPHDFLPVDQGLCYGAALRVDIPGYQKYLWSTGSAGNAILIKAPGTYYLAATDLHSCVGTDSIMVWGKDCIPIGIPNTFVPNSNIAINRIFKPFINQLVSSYLFMVLNRYGETVFETSDYNRGWDGTYKGKAQQAGTYVYYVKYTNIFGYVSESRGTVILLR